MAEVRFASAASDFSPSHSVVRICLGLHGFLTRRSIKARPPGARVVLGFRTKQWLATADAFVRPRHIRILVLASKRRLGPLLPGHIVLILRELFLPCGIVFAYFFTHDSYQPLLRHGMCLAVSNTAQCFGVSAGCAKSASMLRL